jgi:CRP/FNR family transcriptional regulator, cyclic AMP receptor protein
VIPSSVLSIDEQLETLKHVTIFSGFTNEDLRYLCKNCTLVEAPKGECIIDEGSEASEILIILSGHVTIVLNLADDPIEIMEFGPGSCIGETSVIGIQTHSASAVVTENAILLVLLRQVLMQLFDNNKSLFSLLILNMARELARRLHHTDQILLHYAKMVKSREMYHISSIKE